MDIPKDEIKLRRIIGKRGRNHIMQIQCIGGLQVVVESEGSNMKILGGSTNLGAAKWMARQVAPDIEFMDLSKSEEFDARLCADLIPIWSGWVDQLNSEISKTNV